jgi:hypothetical protein
MLALVVIRDEPGLRRAAARLALVGALDAVVLGIAATRLPPAVWMLAHLPALLALATFVRMLPGRPWPVRLGLAAALTAAAALAQSGWMGAPEGGALLALGGLTVRGAVAGLALVLGLLPAHLVLRPPALWWAARPLRATLARADEELRGLVLRSLELWARVEDSLPARSVRVALAGALERLLTATRRWRDLPSPAALPARAALLAAADMLALRRDRTGDPVARARYAEAHLALGVQARHLDQIGASRERLLAQVHRQVAAMEGLHLAAVTQRSADAADGAEALRPLLEELARLGDELDANREAAAALEGAPRAGVP